MWEYRVYGGNYNYSCGGYEPITKEEKVAILERKEKFLEEKLGRIRKIKESIKSGKVEKDETEENEEE